MLLYSVCASRMKHAFPSYVVFCYFANDEQATNASRYPACIDLYVFA